MIYIFDCIDQEKKYYLKALNNINFEFIDEKPTLENLELIKDKSVICINHKTDITHEMINLLLRKNIVNIITRSIGINHININNLQKQKMNIYNIPYSGRSVAEFTVLLMLSLLRNFNNILKNDSCDYDNQIIHNLGDRTVGIIGTGNIGEKVINILKSFGCKILCFDTYKKEGFNYVSMQELLQKSDIISLHLPFNKETYHLIGKEEVFKMKDNAILINVSRGELLDIYGAQKVIKAKNIRLGIDVLEFENELEYAELMKNYKTVLDMEKNIYTPHIAYLTDSTLDEIVYKTINIYNKIMKER